MSDAATAGAEGASEAVGTEAAGDEAASVYERLLRSPKSLYALGSSAAGGLATATDATQMYLTDNWDPTVIVLDTLSSVPALGSASLNAQMDGASGAELARLQAGLAGLTSSQESIDQVGVFSAGFGLNTGAAAGSSASPTWPSPPGPDCDA